MPQLLAVKISRRRRAEYRQYWESPYLPECRLDADWLLAFIMESASSHHQHRQADSHAIAQRLPRSAQAWHASDFL